MQPAAFSEGKYFTVTFTVTISTHIQNISSHICEPTYSKASKHFPEKSLAGQLTVLKITDQMTYL